MVDATDTLTLTIGERVKQTRKKRALTLDQLTDLSGISRRMLINIEKGETNPSIGTLLRLSQALGITLPELVAPPKNTTISITRAGTASTLWHGEKGGTATLVASQTMPAALELWDWHLAPHETHTSEPHTQGTRELIHVHQGTLQLTAGNDTRTLNEGDAASFNGDVPHTYSNPASTPCTFSLTVYEPELRYNAPTS